MFVNILSTATTEKYLHDAFDEWAILIALTYFFTDILYGLIDPRVRVAER